MNQIKMLLLGICLLVGTATAWAQNTRITGKVTDPAGEEIIGANVSVKGTTIGTITDIDGNFSLDAPASGTLVISYIGYKTQEIAISGKSTFNINLQDDSEMLDEVIVVGYGTQKKATLTGAVSQVRGEDVIKGKATTSVAAALQGEIPGLTITRTSSRPGNESINITLRGGASVNENNPMILIDGVEAYQWELSQINPNDVESISVLKDASAAIYGTKAGSGVILVTTKRGKTGKTTVSYSGSVHANIAGKRFPVADGQTWAKMMIEAVTNDSSATGATEEWRLWEKDIYEQLAAGQTYIGVAGGGWKILDPYADQFDAVYGTTWGNTHNITITGGNERLKVLTSLGYANDRSLVNVAYDGMKKYNIRTNIDYDVNSIIKTEFNISYDRRNNESPQQGIGQGIQDMSVFPLYNEYGQFYDTFGGNNVLAKLIEGGTYNQTEEMLRMGGKVTVDLSKITKGLSVSANANFRIRHRFQKERQKNVVMYDWAGETLTGGDGLPHFELGSGVITQGENPNSTDLWVRDLWADNFFQTYGGFVNYNREFNKHNITFVGGITAEKTNSKSLQVQRTGMMVNELDDIKTGDTTTDNIRHNDGNTGSSHSGMVSILGRVNYDYQGIYLLEGIFRRDGSSKFSKENRWANFAGVSAGIRLSELNIIKDLNVFDNLKIRGSYGETGSQTGIGNYDYISEISLGTTVLGTTPGQVSTASVSGMTTLNRTWERVATTNIGLDFGFLQNRLNGTFEYYIRKNKGMLIAMTYPSTLGATAPKTNDGNFRANGWEVELNWNDRIGKDFTYWVGISLSDARTEITKYSGVLAITNGVNNAYKGSQFIEGKPLNAIYVYKTDGIMKTQAEVDAYYLKVNGAGSIVPMQGSTDELLPGSVRRVDLSGDGAITTDDLYYYGDANPHYTFGINLGATYKGFDFSMFIQGVGQQYLLRNGALAYPFASWWTNQNATFYGKTWTEDNPNAQFPATSVNSGRKGWSWWGNDINVNNIWYARAKNMVIGYTLPKKLLNKMKIEKLRVYFSGDNLFEFSNVKDGFDPESQDNSNQGNMDVYARTVSFGIDLTF